MISRDLLPSPTPQRGLRGSFVVRATMSPLAVRQVEATVRLLLALVRL